MSLRTTVIGSYPKVAQSRSDHLPGVIDKWQRQLASEAQLEEELKKVTRRVIQEQEQAGIDLVTDGQIRWEDLAHPVARSVSGISRGTLKRFFDNNVYYRKLEVDGTPRWEKSSVAEDFRFAASVAKGPVKAVLPGPLTLVTFTELRAGQSRQELLDLYTGLLVQEAKALSAAGALEIQLDEPAFLAGEPLLARGIEAINRIFGNLQGKVRRWVACYFHDVSTVLSALSQLEVEVLCLDGVSGPQVLQGLKKTAFKGEVALGLVDARNTRLESADELKGQIQNLAKVIPLERLWLSPNCGLEFLPHESALKKLKLLQEVKEGL